MSRLEELAAEMRAADAAAERARDRLADEIRAQSATGRSDPDIGAEIGFTRAWVGKLRKRGQ